MTRFLFILHSILSLHAWVDRNEPDWESRANTIATAVDAQTNADAAVLMAIMRPESHTLRAAHAGGGKLYRGLWQLARSAVDSDDEWSMVAGLDLDSTRYSADAALRVYHDKLRGCRGNMGCAMARYGGSKHNPRWAKARALDARAFERKLATEEKVD